MTQTIMVDCISANVPAVKASRWADHPAQAYVTGGPPIQWSFAQILSFPAHIRTAQQPGPWIDDASAARELDVELYAATPAHWPAFYDSRSVKDRATCYCSIIGNNGGVRAVVQACQQAGIPRPPRWRIAWWWQNQPGVPLPDDVDVPPPTRDQVLAQVKAETGIDLDPATLWACQFANYARWDLSAVYGETDFARH